MKNEKNDLIQLAILVVLGAALILSLLIPQFVRNEDRSPYQSVSVLTRDQDSTLWATARLGMEQAADELGAELRFLTLSTPNNAKEQTELFLREVENGADAIIIAPADPKELSSALDTLDLTCPVVSMESPVGEDSVLITPDNQLLGQELAQALLEDWTGGTVLLLNTSEASPAITQRLLAARETLEAAQIPTAARTLSPRAVYTELPGILRETESRWVITFEPASTLAAIRSCDAFSISPSLYGVGSNAGITAALESGTVSAVAAWSDYAAGYLAVEYALSSGQTQPDSPVPLTFSILRGEDIYDPDHQKLLFPVVS